jgi:signal transduction histidine kinase
MDLIIRDLLELARLGRRELRKQRVNMVHLVKSAIEDFQPQLHDRQIVWQVGELGDVYADPQLLRLALTNLLDNALKYTRHTPQTQITLGIAPDAADNSEATFYIRDNGCGFDMKEAKKIFEPFERLPQADYYEGIGIGLANVSKIIQKHGGKIWCKSAPSEGATFYFTLPVCPAKREDSDRG